MADPKIAEHIVISALSDPITLENADLTEAAANLMLVDCFDRKVLREFFLDVVGQASSLQRYVSRVRTLRLVKEMMDGGYLSPDKVKEAEERLLSYADASRKSLLRQMDRIMQCPTSEDKVN